ncbi:tryptase beta-2-like [Monodelphis domestica]|uniref:tryptase beta-2-like n=1 Tax=Monodelphis domestica TaxID=13616 RepID=UPI0024E22BF0|nr:tryptase beta-2-like [Monodelphis domestica]
MMFTLLLLSLPLLGNSIPMIQDREQVGIVGGVETREWEFPWQVSMRLFNTTNKSWMHRCGGSLIGLRWVLTAAHCIKKTRPEPTNYMINLRQQYLYKGDRLWPVEKIIIHPNYVKFNVGADIALLKLKFPVTISQNVKIIRLPAASQKFTPEMECWVTGWGNIKFKVPLPRPYSLRKVQVPVMNSTACDKLYHKGSNVSPSVKIIFDDMLCAGETNKGSCQGDSGGALVCNVMGEWLQAGVVSWAIGCGLVNRPSVYARVSAYVKWINDQMK